MHLFVRRRMAARPSYGKYKKRKSTHAKKPKVGKRKTIRRRRRTTRK